MNGELSLRNRQRTCQVDLRLLRRITRCLLADFIRPQYFELGIHLVDAVEMAHVNQTFLRHQGSTDVITFDYGKGPFGVPASAGRSSKRSTRSRVCPSDRLKAGLQTHGEIFLSLDDAVSQARRFRTTWQSELVRYLIHGVLHLCGYDDERSAARLRMKRAENRLLRELSRRFALSELGRDSKLHG
jgi:rRNA maturation RNase YbeY